MTTKKTLVHLINVKIYHYIHEKTLQQHIYHRKGFCLQSQLTTVSHQLRYQPRNIYATCNNKKPKLINLKLILNQQKKEKHTLPGQARSRVRQSRTNIHPTEAHKISWLEVPIMPGGKLLNHSQSFKKSFFFFNF